MTAKEWREHARAKAVGKDLVLPSGMVMRCRRPGPLQYAAWQRLPLMIASAAERGTVAIGNEEATEIARFLRELLVWCCLEPRVAEGDTAAEDEILPRENEEADWMYIVAWAMRLREAEALSTLGVV
jgi:hypothetical protein